MQNENFQNGEYPFSIGDIVSHIKEPGILGVVKFIDTNLPHPTTCGVQWSDNMLGDIDIQWTNKLIKHET